MRWFRFYDDALDDPKVQGLPDNLFRVWVNLLCVASKNAGKINEADVPFLLRIDAKKAAAAVQALVERGLIDRFDNGTEPHNWNGRQYKSDVSTERVKRFRNGQRNVSCNVSETANETPPETEADTEQKEEPTGSSTRRGSRLPDDWVPDEVFAASEGLTASEITREANKFRDYWRGLSGQRGVKSDWTATWRNWVRKAAEGRKRPAFDEDQAYWGVL